MSKQRYVNTKFWSDDWIAGLSPIEKLLFLYLLTNERTNIAGIYELPLKFMSIETGVELEMIKAILTRFELSRRVYYIKGWVCIINFIKHQQSRKNEKVKRGIEIVLEELPDYIKQELTNKNASALCLIDVPSMSHRCPSNYSDSDSDLDPDSDIDISSANSNSIKEILKSRSLKASNSKNQRWQDVAVEIVDGLKEGKVRRSSIFKCCKVNLWAAEAAFRDCKELDKMNARYFLKLWNQTNKQ